ncbi:hypothetical protein A9G13_10550 [Gilliamella sp. wkB178]|uniref:SPOR domain-containing protein n=1 Tax=Gilliamella sp. wkB178 TaxID=3120259 RepID=UPI00080ECEA2|nr:SPOR domain-containing protein [Gilliamella apicola]OCG06688.1 hypothetical protein A9G13_10550 [Gilliamella apicola]
MRVDKDDRYVTEQSNKVSTPSLQLPSFLKDLSKKKLVIAGLAIVIILLLLSLLVFRSSNKKEPTPTLLTPAQINSVDTTETTNNSPVDGSNGQNSTVNNAQPGNANPVPTNAPETNTNQLNIPENPEISNSNTPANTPNVSSPVTQNSVTRTPTNEIVSNTSTHANNTKSTKLNPPVIKNTSTKKDVNPKEEKNSSGKNAKIKNDQYTIQITASTSADKLKQYVKQHNITNYQIHETKRNNTTWFVLTKGSYASMDEAKKAIKALPSALQKDKPWVKSGASLNKEKVIK